MKALSTKDLRQLERVSEDFPNDKVMRKASLPRVADASPALQGAELVSWRAQV